MTPFNTPIEPNSDELDELSAYLSGEQNEKLETQRLQSPEFDARVQRTRRTLGKLRSVLYRFDCPSPDQLRDYHLGDLSEDARRKVAEHLDTCATCQHELTAFATNYVSLTPMPEREVKPERLGFLDVLKEVIEVFIAQPIDLSPQLVLRTRSERGEDEESSDERRIEYRVPGKESWSIVIKTSEAQFADGDISGQLKIGSHETGPVRAFLLEAGNFAQDTELDPAGWFDFHNLDPGVYSLWLEMTDARVEITNITIA